MDLRKLVRYQPPVPVYLHNFPVQLSIQYGINLRNYMKTITLAALAVLALSACSGNKEPTPDVLPVVEGPGSEPEPLTPDRDVDGPPRLP